ncbi:putative pectinesterase 11 [Carex littledalei]|uniref:Pectinesterase n=1 Tax=Carex littledalei TaxID=544730 RepID=A0A833RQD3_9POAL|nr:putative pectinesterase 11 [Carex littledalei]
MWSKKLLCLSLLACFAMSGLEIASASSAVLIRVDQSGDGDYTKIQDAIDSVPSNNSVQTFILLAPGVYSEKVVVPADKPYITLSGTDANSTIITWNEAWFNQQSATLSILASDFVGRYLTVQNTLGPNGPAIALQIVGDRAAFYACRFLSFQDTLLDDAGRHYFKNCFIQGTTDFIFGNGLSFYEKCHLNSISTNGGAMTAQRRSSEGENTGFTFFACKVTGVGRGSLTLGRPWGPYSRVVFAFSYMSDSVLPSGWDDWGISSNQRTAYYGEYQCSGPGSDVSKRVTWSHQLSPAEASPFITKAWINGLDWLRPVPTSFIKPPHKGRR